MKQSPRWISSAACADATSPQSKEFCASYRATETRLTSLPQEADPQSALLSRLVGLQPDTVRLLLSIFLAAACEVISALGFFAILPVAQKTQPQKKPEAQAWKPPTWRNPAAPPVGRDSARRDATGHDAARQSATRKNPR
jgi:hypothetical protein